VVGPDFLKRLSIYSGVVALFILAFLLVLVVAHAADPALDVYPYGSLLYVLLVFVLWSGIALAGFLWERYPDQRTPLLIVAVIALAIFVAHLYIIELPATAVCHNSSGTQGCVMDEVYYVPAAQMILAGTKCSPGFQSCNLEHPFLTKALIAAGITMFGNGDFGWRIFPVIFGTLSIPLVYAIAYFVSMSKRLALFAAAFFSVDTLFFVHSSIAVLDVPAIFFALAAFLVYFAKLSFWRFDRLMLAGVLLGVSLLAKETGVFYVMFLVTYHLLWGGGQRRDRVLGVLSTALFSVFIFGVGLQAYDALFVPSYGSFLDNIYYIFTYGSKLIGGGWTDSVFGNIITPIDWLVYYSPIAYSVTRVTVSSAASSYTYVSVGYWGVANFVEVWMIWVWVPYVGYQLWKARRVTAPPAAAAGSPTVVAPPAALSEPATVTSSSSTPTLIEPTAIEPPAGPVIDLELGLAKLAMLWLGWTYLSYLVLGELGRVTYPYYFLQAIPAVALGAGYLVTRKWFQLPIALILLAMAVGWFVLFYPDKSFLPVWIRAMLGT
jgi:predicted membrane-bound dolichyl-phosphate-mannose-protein mannosyltransferase